MDVLTALVAPVALLVAVALAARFGRDSRDGAAAPPQPWIGGGPVIPAPGALGRERPRLDAAAPGWGAGDDRHDRRSGAARPGGAARRRPRDQGEAPAWTANGSTRSPGG
jgi:hypothetical protein